MSNVDFLKRAPSRVTSMFVAVTSLTALAAASPAVAADIDLGVVDVQNTQYAPQSVWDRHFAVYSGNNATSVRAPTGWSDQQFPDGTWRDATWLPYMKEAMAKGLRLSIDLETVAAPPAWFIDANPDARLVDQNGMTTQYQTVSYWWPGMSAMIHSKTDKMLSMLAAAGVLASTDYVVASFGASDEPIYPPQWTVGDGSVAPGFWCYDVHAQADFRLKMQAQYTTLAAANAAWGTGYASWAAVTVPKPGTVPTAEWSDVLSWYRQEKRAFIAWQITDTQALLAKYAPVHTPMLVIPVPGDHIVNDQMNAAIASESSSDPAIVQMNDTGFLLDMGNAHHAAVHFTGMPDMPELEYIRSYLHNRGYAIPFTAENVNTPNLAGAVGEYTAEALAEDLDGFDYLYGSTLFNTDGMTASANMQPATSMFGAIASGHDQPRTSLSLPQNFVLVQNACVDIAPAVTSTTGTTPATEMCLTPSGQLIVYHGSAVWWKAPAPLQNCPLYSAWNNACFAAFQGDGNFVLYNGQTPYWTTNTAASGSNSVTGMVLSASKPYITFTNANGSPMWDSTSGRHY